MTTYIVESGDVMETSHADALARWRSEGGEERSEYGRDWLLDAGDYSLDALRIPRGG